MKLNQVSAVEDNTSFTSTKFSVADNNVAFKVLSTSLYSDKPKAILRELVCNAADANKEAGKEDIPVEVTLPSMLDEYLTISDSGNGMPEKFLMERYTVLFDSTKRDTNDAIGGFGIGRLSAFSLVESYTIETIHEGTKITAYAYVDNHVPNVTIVGKEHSDAPSGTTIKIPFSCAERMKLEMLCKELFQYWDVPPKADGVPVPTASKMIHTNDDGLEYYIVHSTSYGYIYDDRSLLPLIFPEVLVGGIPYNVPREMYEMNTKIAAYADKLVAEMFALRDLIGTTHHERNTFILNIPIGDIELSPSREKVETNEATAMYLLKKFHEIGEVLQESMQSQIEAAHDDLDDLASSYLNDTYFGFSEALLAYKEQHGAILNFAKNQATKYRQCVDEGNLTKAAKLILGTLCHQYLKEVMEYKSSRYLNFYTTVFDTSHGFVQSDNTYQRYHPLAKKGKWSTKTSISSYLGEGRIAVIDSSDPLGSKVIRDMRIFIDKLQDDDVDVVYQYDGKNHAEVKEFFEDYLELEVIDVDYEEALDYIRANRKKKATANVNRTLNKPFSSGYTINEFYTNVEKYPDCKNIVIYTPVGSSSRATALNNFANRLREYIGQFNRAQVYITNVKEPSNKRYIKFEEETDNLMTIDLTKQSGWLNTRKIQSYYFQVLDFIAGKDAKTFKLVHFNLGLINHWNVSHSYRTIFNLQMRNLYRHLFTESQRKVIGTYTQSFAHYLQHLHKSNVLAEEQTSGPKYLYSTQDAIQLYAKSTYIDKSVLFPSLLEQRREFYLKLKEKKEGQNDTTPTNA